ncbi:MAG TPA: glycosyltransferase [Pyrinomonadaceae bacterium]|jgi:glycosyltransferase involved in cell wall biosynthesis
MSTSEATQRSKTETRVIPLKIAILIPCYNEEVTITETIRAFHAELPEAQIYVFDNNSSDRTAEFATQAGAHVLREPRQGKGFVVQTMFRRVEADVYIMVDGDATYPAQAVHRLIGPILSDEADMVVGSRLQSETRSEFRQLNRWGNKLALAILNSIFGVRLTDILSGYRAFNRKFVKAVPLFGGGFEIETELTIKAVARGFRIVEIPTTLTSRPAGSNSKIKFFRDGFIILNTILALFRDYKPLTFFGSVGLVLVLLALLPGIMVVINVARTGVLTSLSVAVLAIALGLTGMLSMVVGLILHTIVRRFQEIEHTLAVRGEADLSVAPTRVGSTRDEL